MELGMVVNAMKKLSLPHSNNIFVVNGNFRHSLDDTKRQVISRLIWNLKFKDLYRLITSIHDDSAAETNEHQQIVDVSLISPTKVVLGDQTTNLRAALSPLNETKIVNSVKSETTSDNVDSESKFKSRKKLKLSEEEVESTSVICSSYHSPGKLIVNNEKENANTCSQRKENYEMKSLSSEIRHNVGFLDSEEENKLVIGQMGGYLTDYIAVHILLIDNSINIQMEVDPVRPNDSDDAEIVQAFSSHDTGLDDDDAGLLNDVQYQVTLVHQLVARTKIIDPFQSHLIQACQIRWKESRLVTFIIDNYPAEEIVAFLVKLLSLGKIELHFFVNIYFLISNCVFL
uniref:DNA helicase n=1 Tax=Heterorhabditis bacteriophora TaxID=37862 RepID=A0A1I7X676_HETBA